MLEKRISFDQQITEDGQINVRQITRILEDGKELSKSYHRHVVMPLDNVENEDDRTKLIAGAIYTPELIKAYKKKMKEQEAEMKNK
uniref:Uncharacterized protein n=1 Tax=viral metagenome TaxID=1070528 RepID=A0A6M3XK26_9ZZZZ